MSIIIQYTSNRNNSYIDSRIHLRTSCVFFIFYFFIFFCLLYFSYSLSHIHAQQSPYTKLLSA